MKKQLNKEDIIKLLNDNSLEYTITRPSKHCTRIEFKPTYYNCFGCKDQFHYNQLELRLDARVTSLQLPRKFCKTCLIKVDDILSRLKTKSIPNWIKPK